mmetsp:Transcript_4960/g.13720  ORF Transcript_4960/g.13720 Transcript_4960/m.13720 type:complete len:201 (+) Transcript_4960:291-893(+)
MRLKSEPERAMKGTAAVEAIALASIVFPQPGGPVSRRPFGQRAPIVAKREGAMRHSMISSASLFAGPTPATSSRSTLGLRSSMLVVAGIKRRCKALRAAAWSTRSIAPCIAFEKLSISRRTGGQSRSPPCGVRSTDFALFGLAHLWTCGFRISAACWPATTSPAVCTARLAARERGLLRSWASRREPRTDADRASVSRRL